MEVAFPVLVVGLYPSGEFAYIVMLAIPLGQMLDIVFHRIVTGYEVRVDIAVQVLVPRLDASFQGTDGHRVAGSLVERLETVTHCVHAIFWDTSHHVQP